MEKFTLKQCAQTFVAATVLTLSGCGGGGGDSTPPATGTAYYVDSAVSGVNYKCGSQEGITGANGEFTFEVGTSCTFYLGDITLRSVDAALLEDGATVYETDAAVAQVLQSLDADANPDNGITINAEIVQALADANITALPETVDETEELLQVIEESGGTVVSEEAAQTHVMETLLVGKTVYVTYINETGEKIIEEIVHGADGISTATWTEDGEAKMESFSYTITGYTIYTGDEYHVATEFTADYILLEDYDGGEADGTTKIFFDRAAAQTYLDSLEGSGGGATPAGFTTEMLNGKTLYNAYFETDTNEWELSVFSFTDTAVSAYQDSYPSVIYDGSYTITSEGYISYVSGSDGPEYIKAVSQTTDYMQLCWSDEISHLSTCTGDDEYFYFDYQKAKDFIDAKNIDVLANSEEVTISGNVTFKDASGNQIAVPTDAGVRIVSDVDMENNDWGNSLEMTVNSDGTFGITKSIYENSYKEGHTFQVVVFKNHLETDELSWNCREDLYKFVSSTAEFDSWSNIEVYPSDYQDRSTDICY